MNKKLITQILIGIGVIAASYYAYNNYFANTSIEDSAIKNADVKSKSEVDTKAKTDIIPQIGSRISVPYVDDAESTESATIVNTLGDYIRDSDRCLYDKNNKLKGSPSEIGFENSLLVFEDSNGNLVADAKGLPITYDNFGNIKLSDGSTLTPLLVQITIVDPSLGTYKEVGGDGTIYDTTGNTYENSVGISRPNKSTIQHIFKK